MLERLGGLWERFRGLPRLLQLGIVAAVVPFVFSLLDAGWPPARL